MHYFLLITMLLRRVVNKALELCHTRLRNPICELGLALAAKQQKHTFDDTQTPETAE